MADRGLSEAVKSQQGLPSAQDELREFTATATTDMIIRIP
jgi:hypothetical protein